MIYTLLDRALAVASRRSEARGFLVGAAILRDDGAIVVSRNERSQEPCPSAHAEARALRKAGAKPALVVVARVRKGAGGLAMSRPCADCAAKLRAAGAREVWFTDESGELVRWV